MNQNRSESIEIQENFEDPTYFVELLKKEIDEHNSTKSERSFRVVLS